MSAICPDNSTECLLRALLDAQSGFSWDPLSFAFTAAIGVLAVIVAGVTVFQGLLSAGPGRLKASRGAIGVFAVKTQTKFHWDELRYRTTARVPFIRRLSQLQDSEDGAVFGAIRIYPARWVTLLESACLTLRLDDGLEEEGSFVEVVTDHLPADITAPPAWTTVKNAVILACIAGCNVVTKDETSIYPIVRGPTCQLRFREHPDLGTVAVFDLLLQRRFYPHDRHTDLLLEYQFENFNGPIGYREKYSMSLDYFDSREFLPDLHIRRGDCRHQLCSKMGADPEKIKLLLNIATYHNVREKDAVFAPLIAKIPISPRVVSFAAGPTGLLSILKRLENVRDRHQRHRFPIIQDFVIDLGPAAMFSLGNEDYGQGVITTWEMGWSWLYSSIWDIGLRPRMNVPFGKGGEQEIRVVPVVLACVEKEFSLMTEELVSEFSMKPATFSRMNKSAHWREILQFQLLEIDWWLSRRGGSLAACETISMWWDVMKKEMVECSSISFDDDVRTFDFHGARNLGVKVSDHEATAASRAADAATTVDQELMMKEMAEAPGTAKAKKFTDEEIQGFAKELAERKKLREILGFRAAVWTLYLATAADISSVLDNDVGERIIQLL